MGFCHPSTLHLCLYFINQLMHYNHLVIQVRNIPIYFKTDLLLSLVRSSSKLPLLLSSDHNPSSSFGFFTVSFCYILKAKAQTDLPDAHLLSGSYHPKCSCQGLFVIRYYCVCPLSYWFSSVTE